MKIVKNIAAWIGKIALVFFLVLLFLPKDSFYYIAKDFAKKEGLELFEKEADDGFFGAKISGVQAVFGGPEVASVDTLHLGLFGARAEEIKVGSIFSNYIPKRLEYVTISFLSLGFSAKGEFGFLQGSLSPLSRSVTLELIPSSEMATNYKNTLRFLKLENGKYVFTKNF